MRIAIVTNYFFGDRVGLLGPQMAATIIEKYTSHNCIVVAVSRNDDLTTVKSALIEYFDGQRPVIGFSLLAGRPDLFKFAKELTESGAFTILAGPQADVDFLGEENWQNHPHRFKGLSSYFTCALHGPAEQIVDLLENLEGFENSKISGLLRVGDDDQIVRTSPKSWEDNYLSNVSWDNLFRVAFQGLEKIKVTAGQVVQFIGCPYAVRQNSVEVDGPASLSNLQNTTTTASMKGCSFCDVASDKQPLGKVGMDAVLSQIDCLPSTQDGKKIPFELINENALKGLAPLLNEIRDRGLEITQIDLVLRADWLIKGEGRLRETLKYADEMGIVIRLSSIGFESFNDRILKNLNKGITKESNLKAVSLMRQLGREFPTSLRYSRQDGAIHGLIHPTPWDTKQTESSNRETYMLYNLPADILPTHSTPLIIHHGSALGDWIREVERENKVQFKRLDSIIEWWDEPKKI